MTDWGTPYGGDFLKADQIRDTWGGAVELTISAVNLNEQGAFGPQWELDFHEIDNRWGLNKTNGGLIAAQHGGQVEDWVDKKIILDAVMGDTPSGEKLVIRVRQQLAAPVAPAAPNTPSGTTPPAPGGTSTPSSNAMLAASQAATQPAAAAPRPAVAPTNADGDPDDAIPF